MSKNVLTVQPFDAMHNASESMKVHCVRHMVVSENNRLIGILSDLDIKKWEASRAIDSSRENWSVALCMTRSIHKVRENDPLLDAIEWLALGHYHALPVENDAGILTGIITTTDMLHVLMDMMCEKDKML